MALAMSVSDESKRAPRLLRGLASSDAPERRTKKCSLVSNGVAGVSGAAASVGFAATCKCGARVGAGSVGKATHSLSSMRPEEGVELAQILGVMNVIGKIAALARFSRTR